MHGMRRHHRPMRRNPCVFHRVSVHVRMNHLWLRRMIGLRRYAIAIHVFSRPVTPNKGTPAGLYLS